MKDNIALIIIDMQIGLLTDPLYPIHATEELLKNINALIDKAHASAIPVVFIQHTEADEEILGINKPGWFIYPQLHHSDKDDYVVKYTPDAFHNTDLGAILEQRDVGHLVVAGLQTEYCVDTTCRRAFSLGYKTILVQDGHSTTDTRFLTAQQIIMHHNQVLGGWFVKLIDHDEIDFRKGMLPFVG